MIQQCPLCGNYVEGKLIRSTASKAARTVLKKGGMKAALGTAGSIIPGIGNVTGFVVGAAIDAAWGDKINEAVDGIVDEYITDEEYSFKCPKCRHQWNVSQSNNYSSQLTDNYYPSSIGNYTFSEKPQLSLRANEKLTRVITNCHALYGRGRFSANCRIICNARIASYIQQYYNRDIPTYIICKEFWPTYQELADHIDLWERYSHHVRQRKNRNTIYHNYQLTTNSHSEYTEAVETAECSIPRATIYKVWPEYDVTDTVCRGLGMRIHLAFEVNEVVNKGRKIIIRFFHSNGSILQDTNGLYCTNNGQVAIVQFFSVENGRGTFNDYHLFMPYSELHLSQSSDCYFVASIQYGNEELAKSVKYPFQYECDCPPKANINKVWFEQDVINGEQGMKIHVSCRIDNMLQKKARACAYFYYSDGTPIKDRNGLYGTTDWQVCVWADIYPKYVNTLGEFELFLPFSELHISHPCECYFTVSIWNDHDELDSGGKTEFTYNCTLAAVIKKIWVDHNVVNDYTEKGMNIHVSFDVYGMKKKKGLVVAFFYHSDNAPIKDTNNQYCTDDGQVATCNEFKPGYKDASYDDFLLFIPYSELHLTESGNIYFKVSIIKEEALDSCDSEMISFTMN